MDIKENELLNGSVGFPNSTENNGTLNNPQNNIQPELPTLEPAMNTEVVSFPAEMQTEEMLQPTMPSEFNVFQGQMPQAVEQQPELPTLEPATNTEVVSFPAEMQTEEMLQPTMPSEFNVFQEQIPQAVEQQPELPTLEPAMNTEVVSFPAEMQTEEMLQPTMPSEFNVFQEQMPQAVEPQPELPTLEPAMNTEVVSFPVEMQTEEMLQPTMPSEFNVFQEQMPQAVEQPEIPVSNQTTNTEMTGSTEQLNEYGKPINHELLKNLAEDTNNLVNPNMLVSPIGKQKEEEIVEVDEPKVDYEEIKEKKNYALMIIIFLIIVAGILLLPTITSIIGY